MPFIDSKAPSKVRKVKDVWTADGLVLFWTAPRAKDEMNEAVRYVVYRFAKGEKQDLENPANIVAITPNTFYNLPYHSGKESYTYVVTALDRLSNESKSAKRKVKI